MDQESKDNPAESVAPAEMEAPDSGKDMIQNILDKADGLNLEAKDEQRLANAVGETHKTPETELQLGGKGPVVKMAPLKLPPKRRLQTLAVLLFWWYIPVCAALLLVMIFTPILWVLLIPYLVFYFTDAAPERGGRRIQWVRELPYWQYFSDYFPAVMVKEADLDPSKNYIFGYHPHGIISMGAFCTFNTEATGFSEKFPGIKASLCTLSSNFQYPFFRDLIMALGCVPVSRKSIEAVLNSGPGRSVAIVVGGVYKQVEDEDLRKKQEQFMKVVGFSFPVFYGRGIFQYSFGILPVRKPLFVVVGPPIDVPKIEKPTDEDIDKYHQLYIDTLKGIYDKYKNEFAPDRRSSMRMVG